MWGRDAPVQRITDIVGDADEREAPELFSEFTRLQFMRSAELQHGVRGFS